MKLTYFLLFVSLLQSYANTYSQNTKVTLDMKEVTLRSVLDEIENKTDYKFLYEKGIFQTDKIVSIFAKKEKLSSILNKLLNNFNVSVEYIQEQIIIKKNQNNEIPDKESARQQRVSGIVFDENDLPLPGAVILIKGTTTGVTTDFDGKFSISANLGDTLEVSFLGYLTTEIIVTEGPLTITLKVDNLELEEVVVVAQGIEKSRKALGYAISKVDTEETENRAESNIANTLIGKVSGVRINVASGSSGSNPSIRVRTNLSLNGSNSTLIVVDNIPYTGGLQNIDPNDIEAITVLKGLNAALLYGQDGRNGVILITTKSGNAKLGQKSFKATISQISYTNSVANLPDFQNQYGVGNNQVTDATSYGNAGSLGADFDDIDFIPHPLFLDPRFPQFADAVVPYEAAINNVSDFFKTSIGSITSLNIRSTGEKSAFNFATNYTDEDGILGTNSFKRFNLSIGGKIKLGEKVTLASNLTYITRHRNTQTSDFIDNVYRLPRSLDIHNLPFQDENGANVSWYNVGAENPLWTINNTGDNTITNRLVGNVNIEYDINKHHTLKFRGGLQTSNFSGFDFVNKGGVISPLGSLDISSNNFFTIDNTILFESKYDISENIGFDSTIGINSRFRRSRSQDSEYKDQIVYDFFRPNNFRTTAEGDFDTTRENQVGVYGQFDFDYKNYLFLGLSGRYDKTSTVERNNQTIFYPGVSLSFIPTTAITGLKSNTINYLKLRAAYATSAGFPGLYDTRQTLSSDPREFDYPGQGLIVTNSFFSGLSNPSLKPELHKEFEIGLEGRFFNNRVSLEASVFSRISTNQIFETAIAPASGFTSSTINAGRLDGQGLEIDLSFDLFKNTDFKWNVRNTFTTNKTVVKELANGIQQLGNLIVGEELGVFVDHYVLRDSEGNALVNPEDGQLIESQDVGLEQRIIGNVTPDFRLSNIHNIKYKNFSLSAQFEYTHGGSNFYESIEQMFERGYTTDTQNREGSFVIPGVLGDPATGTPIFDANGNTITNTIQVTGNRFLLGNFYNPEENNTYDSSLFRIREIALGYTLNKDNFPNAPFDSLTFTLSGRNIFYYAPNLPSGSNIDPEVRGFNVPTTKRYAISVALNF